MGRSLAGIPACILKVETGSRQRAKFTQKKAANLQSAAAAVRAEAGAVLRLEIHNLELTFRLEYLSLGLSVWPAGLVRPWVLVRSECALMFSSAAE